MITSCPHCGTQYELPDKMLGKKGRCKACNKLFLLEPRESEIQLEEVEMPQPTGSTARLRPISQQEESDDPLAALADAAFDSGSSAAPIRLSPANRANPYDRHDDEDDRPRKRMAKGAKLAMAVGITGCAFAVIGGIIGIVAMTSSDDQDQMVILGVIAIALLAFGAIFAMIAVVNANTAMGHIRHARHPMGGRSEASTGLYFGFIAFGLVLIMLVVGGIWMSKNQDALKFDKTLDAEGNEIKN